MKTLIFSLTLFYSLSSMASYKCSAKIMSKGIGDSYIQTSLSKSFKLAKGQDAGEFVGAELFDLRLNNREYVMNSLMDCRQETCTLEGTVTEILKKTGFLNQYRVNIQGTGEQYYPMSENKILIISCKQKS